MKNKLIIGAGILLTVFLLFLILISGAGGNKIPTEQTLNNTFSGVTCEVKNSGNINYDLAFLTNNVQFDEILQTKNYTKIKFNQTTNFNTLGVAFILKSDSEISLNISLMKNNEELKSTTINLENGMLFNVDLLLENSEQINLTDDFYIAFEQTTSAPFIFDTLLTFIDEV